MNLVKKPVTVAFIGGSGLYDMEGLSDVQLHRVETPFGDPSDIIVVGMCEGKRVVFLPRHGKDHILAPDEVPYDANIWALVLLGVDCIVGFSAVGALTRDIKIGDIVLPDQAFTRFTTGRPKTFFRKDIDKLVAHVNPSKMFCSKLRQMLCKSAQGIKVGCHNGGKFVNIPGPEYSTMLESEEYRNVLHCITVGMTTFPECLLALMACIPYASVQLATDYDNMSGSHLNSDAVVAQMLKNTATAKQLMRNLLRNPDLKRFECECRHALDHAIPTPPEYWSAEGTRKVHLLRGW